MKQIVLIHYHEINLKKKNRSWFERRLREYLEALLSDLACREVRTFHGRMLITLPDGSRHPEIESRLRRVFGVANFAFAVEVPADLESIRSTLAGLVRERDFETFKIDARRSTKEFPMNSQQLNEDLGAFVQGLTGAGVRLQGPDLTCYLEISGRKAYLYFEKIPGGGGLPARTGGKVLCLLSGGIDSPVAAYRLMRRGCQVDFIHFHSFPHTTVESQEKVKRIVRVLARCQLESNLYLIPFAEVQREIVAYAPPPLRVVLYRRFMVRIAELVAQREGAAALVTGDSLGQVASQTLENLRAVSAATRMQIFRPLIGDDKEDIIRAARGIGTYEISIVPDQDCCSLFVPRHPETMASLEFVEKAEAALDVPRLSESAIAAGSTETIAPDFSLLEAGAR